MADDELAQQVAALQKQLQAAQAENQHLQQRLTTQQHDILRLSHWLQGLQRDIQDVYNSVTWLIGDRVAQLILTLLRRPPGPTARDHVERVNDNFQHWQQQFFANTAAQTPLFFPWHEQQEYARWLVKHEDYSEQTLNKLQTTAKAGKKLSLLLWLDPTQPLRTDWLQQTLESIQAQSYQNWQFCLLVPDNYAAVQVIDDKRIQYLTIPKQYSEAQALNQALSNTVDGEYCALTGAYDVLPSHALLQVAAYLAEHQADVLYSDHDYLDAHGQRCQPEFKPDWNPDLFLAQPYVQNLTFFNTALIREYAGFPVGYPTYTSYALLLQLFAANPQLQIQHLTKILYHQRAKFQSNAEVAKAALTDYFQQLVDAKVSITAQGYHRIHYPLPAELPLVSVIIPTRDTLALLRDTVAGVLQHTDYLKLELIIVDNGSVQPATLQYLADLQQDVRVKVLKDARAFNYSRLNNLGVAEAQGDIIALLNNDLAMIHGDWLREMVSHALRPDVGAVGAKLYYPDDSLQHAGVVVGLGGMAGHAFKHLPKPFAGYQARPWVTQNYSAVTAACLVMRRSHFLQVGGLNEQDLPVAFNDVDLCLKLGKAGYRIVWTPYAELYHRESASRGADTSPRKFFRLQGELRYMRQQWAEVIAHDPCYNPNLTVQYEDFSLRW